MRSFKIYICALVIIVCGISGCASSLVYSPSLNLPASPLKKEQGQVILGGILMPETRPHRSEKKNTVKPGGEGFLRYAFSDNFTLSVKGWSDFAVKEQLTFGDEIYNQDGQRGGVAVQGIFQLPALGGYKFAVIPNIAVLSEGSHFQAEGASILLSVWSPSIKILTPYMAIGPAIGFYDREIAGYGAIANVGAAMEVFPNFSVNAEVAGIIQVNRYDAITHGIVSPSVAVSWNF